MIAGSEKAHHEENNVQNRSRPTVTLSPETAHAMNLLWACLAATSGFGLLCSGAVITDVEFDCGPGFQNESYKYLRSVLLVHNEIESDANDTRFQLMSTGAFDKVDSFDARTTLPPVSLLLNYSAALIMTAGAGTSSAFQDRDLMGDLLADYWNAGGVVVMTYSAFLEENMGGTFGFLQNGYKLITSTGSSETGTYGSLGTVAEPTSPIMAGVNSLNASDAWRSNVDDTAISIGSVVVAYWGQGQPMVIRGKKNDRNLVTLNVYIPTGLGTWTGDGMLLIRNALLFSACGKTLHTIREST